MSRTVESVGAENTSVRVNVFVYSGAMAKIIDTDFSAVPIVPLSAMLAGVDCVDISITIVRLELLARASFVNPVPGVQVIEPCRPNIVTMRHSLLDGVMLAVAAVVDVVLLYCVADVFRKEGA
jgi:hypothetical protein